MVVLKKVAPNPIVYTYLHMCTYSTMGTTAYRAAMLRPSMPIVGATPNIEMVCRGPNFSAPLYFSVMIHFRFLPKRVRLFVPLLSRSDIISNLLQARALALTWGVYPAVVDPKR